jgi:hypothetical protein
VLSRVAFLDDSAKGLQRFPVGDGDEIIKFKNWQATGFV